MENLSQKANSTVSSTKNSSSSIEPHKNPNDLPTELYKPLKTRAVASFDEFVAAKSLVYKEYLRCGLIKEKLEGLFITPYDLLPTSTIFVSFDEEDENKEIVGTMTYIRDSRVGLPFERDFPSILPSHPFMRGKTAQISSYAVSSDDKDLNRIYLAAKGGMIASCWTAKISHTDYVFATPSQEHYDLFCHRIGFTQLFEPKPLGFIKNTKGILMAINIKEALYKDRISKKPAIPIAYNFFFNYAPDLEDLVQHYTPSEEELKYLQRHTCYSLELWQKIERERIVQEDPLIKEQPSEIPTTRI